MAASRSWRSGTSDDRTQRSLVTPGPAADLTARPPDALPRNGGCGRWRLAAEICNRGPAPAAPGVQGTFYATDPRTSKPPLDPLCTTPKTTQPLAPGACLLVECVWDDPDPPPIELFFRANDDGTGKMRALECRRGNNLGLRPAARCRTGS